MLSLHDIVARTTPPEAWAEGDNIPWNDPAFSERMLGEHLSQEHDLASRRVSLIDAHVAAIRALIVPPPGRILDLGCGPGLYLSRLADAGYHGVGIDFSPASIDYARAEAARRGHDLELRLQDLRTAGFGDGYDAVLLLYGQLNVFRRDEARSLVARAHEALRPGGVLIVEPQTYEQVERSGHRAPGWSSHRRGLFSPEPHLLLTESFWNKTTSTTTERFYVIDAGTGSVTRHALSTEAYTREGLEDLFGAAGFERVEHRVSLSETTTPDDGLCLAIGFKTA